ncbi:prolipoprotein diacylglyceryl transferase [Falsirhodobacter algicola]|uniref:Phosphatidylglycerol--prolipoprotein diacylglyceryl transferase n=1 Tax=Falsirhodobacter algicola TaxID=2692330 RepID=A0A8J8SKS2_9RHOB|nr:prolipoprotein diacylglyceryl transferase [Falsirhodobacter algicola]QUS35756.1 prolipoprotein diacylglyceryl transferase [Falsirhodobacter algicola]
MSYIPFPDISPEIFTLHLGSFAFSLRWYALAYITGLLLGWWIVRRAIACTGLWPAATPPMTAEQVERLLTWVIFGVVLGGRMGFVLFYEPGYYAANPGQILQVWQGGMSFHGGFLGVIVATWIFCAREGIGRLAAADLMALAVPPGLFFGRIANFINAELWGRPTDLPWGVAFPGDAAQFCPGVEGICARHPSQLYEAALEGILLFALIWVLILRRGWLKWPGAICGTFVAGYGIARFLVEFVRQPDAQFVSPGNPLGLAWQIGGYGLTQGQALSLPMIAIGLWLILRARRA